MYLPAPALGPQWQAYSAMPVVLTRATQQAAGYRQVGGIERCAYCRFYGSANNCGRILGPVSPAGWCRFFSRMVWLRMDGGDTDMGILGPPGVTLDLSFMGGTLPTGVTFTRASTATYFASTGTMQTAAVNAPRFDYATVARTLNGLLIEEARTNLLLSSGNLGNTGYWAQITVTATGGIAGAPDGTASLTQVTETTATNIHYIGQNPTLVASTSYAFSIYAKAAGTRYLQLSLDDSTANGGFATFDLQAGTISQALAARGTGVIGTATIQPIANGFYRCSIVTTIGAATTGRALPILSNVPTPGFAPNYAGNTANSVLLWGAQLEQGAFPTSYIPTTNAAVTRSADQATMPTAAWFSATNGSVAIEAMLPQVNTPENLDLGIFDNGTGNESIVVRQPGNVAYLAAYFYSSSALVGSLSSSANPTAATPFKVAASYSAGLAIAMCFNGGTVVTGTTTAIPAVNRLVLGQVRAVAPDGYIRRVRYWPRVLTNTEMQQVTT